MSLIEVTLPLLLAGSPSFTTGEAKTLVESGISAMGGRPRLERIATVKVSSIGRSYFLEQSERPTGPFLDQYSDTVETIGLAQGTWAAEGTTKGTYGADWRRFARSLTFARDGQIAEAKGVSLEQSLEARLRLALGPERVLLAAAAAPDLRQDGREMFQGIPHDVVAFSWGSQPVRILLNGYTHLPTAVELASEWPGFWTAWGDVRSRWTFGNWELEPNGVRFPLQWGWERNGLAVREQTVTKVEFTDAAEANAGLSWPMALSPKAELFKLPPAYPFKTATIAPGLTQFQAQYNCAVIDQGDGLVFIEGVLSSEYMEGVIEAAQKAFPGKPLKAVVSTSDAWPHLAGLRPFVARGVPVIALDASRDIVRRMVTAPHTHHPDTLQSHPRRANIRTVSQSMEIGKGENRIQIYPTRGEGTERQMLIYFPARKLLYASDAIQPQDKGFFFPIYPDEVRQAVDRNRLPAETVFGMHLPPRPWKDVLDFLNRI